MGFDGIPRVFSCYSSAPRLSPSRLAFVGGVWIGIVVTICQARLLDAASPQMHRRAKRLISPEIHAAIPDNGVENFITPARDSAIEWRGRGEGEEGDR